MNSLLSQLGKAVRKQRKSKNLSQEKLAELAGIHRTYLSSLERGERNVSLINIKKIATALNISLSDLLKNL